ncbi:MAG TPA: tRNA dihydrouridine synthase DusB [Chromatiales bacterium]|nr:tRNA dihydrouridine synthase DusB [Chromatiales bacterium]
MNSALNIGGLELSGPVLLAPMAGITDAPFRRLCRTYGASLAASEMTTANPGLWHSRKSRDRLRIDTDLSPRVVQLTGNDPAWLADAAARIQALGADIIDINMGCPARKVCRRQAGSALLQDEELVRRILDSVVNAVRVPVTLKMRTGTDPEHRNGVAIAKLAEQCGVQAITVHGRTRACRFEGAAEYDTIRAIKQTVSIPVFANGDIDSPQKAASVLEQTGADGIMIGRAARGQPWIFSQINHYLLHKKLLPAPSVDRQRDMILSHLEAMYCFYGEHIGIRMARKHLIWYSAHLQCNKAFRQRAVEAETTSEQLQITRDYFSGRDDGGNRDARLTSPPVRVQWQKRTKRKLVANNSMATESS